MQDDAVPAQADHKVCEVAQAAGARARVRSAALLAAQKGRNHAAARCSACSGAAASQACQMARAAAAGGRLGTAAFGSPQLRAWHFARADSRVAGGVWGPVARR